MAAFFIAAGFTKTGLGARIAYALVALSGRSTLGLGYGLVATDFVLAPAIASNTARAGGVVLPILQSIARTAIAEDEVNGRRTAAYLTLKAYQGTVETSAIFLTAMEANPLVVQLAANQGVAISWTTWAIAAVVPGFVSPSPCRWWYTASVRRVCRKHQPRQPWRARRFASSDR
jgi:DASS family divalent anion:Na+ symporter